MIDAHMLRVDGTRTQWANIRVKGRSPPARYGHTLCAHETGLFMFGGQTGGGITNEMQLLVHLMWKPMPILNDNHGPGARIGAAAAIVDGKLYVIGGAVNGHAKNDVYYLTIGKNEWESPSMYGLPPLALTGHCCAVIGSEIFIYGGGDGETPVNDLFVIDTVSHKWIKPQAEGTRPVGGIGCSMVTFGLKIVVYGGYGNRMYSDDVAVLDSATMTWSHPMQRGDPLPLPRVGHTAVVVGKSDMFVFGGSTDGRPSKELWCLDLQSMHWDKYNSKGEIPYARFGHTAVAVGRSLYVFGGSIRFQQQSNIPGVPQMAVDYRNTLGDDLYIMEFSRQDLSAEWIRPVIAGTFPEARYRHLMVNIDGRLVILTGSHGGKTVWVLDTGFYDERSETAGKSLRDQVQMIKSIEDKRREEGKANLQDVDPQTQLMLKFLQDLNLSKYNRVFLKQEVDWNTLLKCTDDDLVDIGVKAIGPRKKILKRLAQLNATDLVDPSTAVMKAGGKRKPLLFAGRYELITNDDSAKQGGSAAAVHFARDIRTNREVVIKLVADSEQWEREIKYLRALRSPEQYVVELIDYEEREQRKLKKLAKKQQNLLGRDDIDEEPVDLPPPATDGVQKVTKSRTVAGMKRSSADGGDEGEDLEDGVEDGDASKDVKMSTVPGTDIPLWDYYDPFTAVGYRWMVLERGKMTLREFFQDTGVIYETQRKAIFERILLIISHLSSRRVVHVDMKPENLVFFGDEMRLKVIDFGSAARSADLISPVATPSYCSPEMAKAWVLSKSGDPKLIKASPAMDIWASGMILFESYLGYPLLAGREDTYGLLAGEDDWLATLPWGVVDNGQAHHLLKKILSKAAKKRPIATEILKSPYLTWGLDTVEISATFGALQQNCEALRCQLEEIERDAQELTKV